MKKRELKIVENHKMYNQETCNFVLFLDEENDALYIDTHEVWNGCAVDILENYQLNNWKLSHIDFYHFLDEDEEVVCSDYSVFINYYTESIPMNELLKYSYNQNCVLCNTIHHIDESVYDNALFDWDNVKTEILQWYITDFSESDAEYLSEHSDLLITYSDMLDCYILCMTQMENWNELKIGTDLK